MVGKNSRSKAHAQVRKSNVGRNKALRLALPSYPNAYGNLTLSESDFNAPLVKALAPYNTIGNQNYFVRSVEDAGDLLQSAAGDNYSALYFTVGSSTAFVNLATVFDQYRLKAVTVSFSPRSGPLLAAGNVQPRFWTCLDYDDANPINRAAIEQYDSCVVSPPGAGQMRALRPRAALAAYSGAFTSFANMGDMWCDVASPYIQFYGVKFCVEGGVLGQTALTSYAVNVTAFWEFRSTR